MDQSIQILKTNGSGVLSWAAEPTTGLLWDADSDTGIQVEEGADEDKIRFDTLGVERMIIDETGKVGIGTSAPTALLTLKDSTWGTGSATNVIDLQDAVGSSKFRINQYGWLYLARGTETTPYFTITSSGGIPSLNMNRPGVSGSDIKLFTSGYDSVLPTGLNVGDTTTVLSSVSQTRLKTKGWGNTSASTNLSLTDSADTSLFTVLDDGTVDLPNTTFATGNNGVISKNGTPFIHDFNYGDNGAVTTTGRNTFIGENAGNLTMGGTATANYQSSDNTFIGNNAGNSVTTGFRNVYIGQAAGDNNLAGRDNVFIGGYHTGSNSTASDSIHIGESAGYVSSGSNNIFLGSVSGASNTTGVSNIFLGGSAGSLNVDGSFNIAIGQQALSKNISGIGNSTLGSFSLFGNTTGNYNAALGHNAGRYIANGSTENQTSGTSVYLGGNAKALADGDTNEIVIGYNTIGKGSNTVNLGNDSITETHLNGEINFDNYKFPIADGTTDQILKTDGAGALTWTDQSGGGSSTFLALTDTPSSYTAGSILFTSGAATTEDNTNFFWDDANDRLGIGTATPNSGLSLNSSFSVKRTATATNVNTANEVIIGVTDTSVARTITLDTDDVVAGRIFIIKDESGAAGTNNITIDTEGSETIDGLASVTITVDYGVLRVYSNGTNWFSF